METTLIKIIKMTYSFLTGKIGIILLILVLLIQGFDAFAQEEEKKKKKKKIKHFQLKVGLTTIYDNNILKYSDKYLDRFMNGQDPGRFHIETYDDLIFNPTVEGVYTVKLFKNVNTRINASISPKFYTVNSIKTWYSWGIGIQQYFTKKASLKILYSYIPDFYVRHFRDDQWIDVYGYLPISFTPYAFSKDNFGIYFQNTFFKNTRIRLAFYYARYYHNEHYTEYDSKDKLYAVNVYQRLHKNFRLDFAYTFVNSDAKGYDSSVDTPETTTGPDATFEEDRFSLGFVWKLPKLKKRSNNLDVDFYFLSRYYSSPYPAYVDPLHAGRVDHNYRMLFTYNLRVSKPFNVSLFYNWLMRDSDTKAKVNSIYVSNEKDYRQDKFGLKMVYNFRF